MSQDKHNLVTRESYEKLLLEKERVEKELAKARREFGASREGEGARLI
ncbi:hypothetical protein KJ596_04420 [Patescibacteria group bacterium]|nr:hypothetical protein [Patescibacteria group bacterium]MBU1868507.1 hypothetical protein [Patescibacteria group bacterium]